MRFIVPLLFLFTLFAGCAEDGAATEGTLACGEEGADESQCGFTQPPPEVTETTGNIRGIVVTETLQPIVGATVNVIGTELSLVTEEGGTFVFGPLDAATYFVEASKQGWKSSQISVEVEAGVSTPPIKQIALIAIPGAEPRAETYDAEGFIACGAGTPLTFHTCPGLSADKSTVTLPFTGSPDWIQVETDWESTQPAGEQLYLVYYFCTDGTCGDRAGRWSEGNRDAPWIARYENENNRTSEMVAVYASPGGPANGTGVALDQAYITYATFFYNIEPDEDWNFLTNGDYPVPA